MEIEQSVWGFTPEGEAAVVYTMRSASGAEVSLTNVGAAVLSLRVPDRTGRLTDVVLGYDTLEAYLNDFASMGKCAGRWAGLLPAGSVAADGAVLNLPRNDPRGHLDGGRRGFGARVWEGRVETNRVVFSLYSPDGEEGYPGGVSVEAVYDWDDDCALEVTLLAKSEATTPINLTQHLWFDLGGAGAAGHVLSLAGEDAVGVESIDFGGDGIVWRRLDKAATLPAPSGQKPVAAAATLYSPASGIELSVGTTHPAVFVENGGRLQGSTSREGTAYTTDSGIAVWTGATPPPTSPPALLDPDSIYEEHIVYRFSVRD